MNPNLRPDMMPMPYSQVRRSIALENAVNMWRNSPNCTADRVLETAQRFAHYIATPDNPTEPHNRS